ncbi:hypothetical protein [Streptomyces sp. NK08204]|uniref:hypothetical protein n=1 Tax=Streptomyces sp. NK08204 TaxID=2873260 RepID=UPI001CEDF3F9|nr:hypothetical protein [Streptomyces sp. NK08204]
MIAQEIVEDIQAALGEFAAIAQALGGEVSADAGEIEPAGAQWPGQHVGLIRKLAPARPAAPDLAGQRPVGRRRGVNGTYASDARNGRPSFSY